ncbi:Uncharacterised protein [Pseudomonas aeruginosa]|nr:Uncharacterised protein [Pseudomonas aeruginosa]
MSAGVLRGVADLLHRLHHLADHVLQLAEEGVEALGDGAQLVGALAAQAAGKVAFALGDVVEHADQLAQRPGDAVADQPDHQQAEGRYHQAGQAHAEDILLALVAQLALELLQFAEYRRLGNLQHEGPAHAAVGDGERQEQLDVAVLGVDVVERLVDREVLQVVHFVAVEDAAGGLAELAVVAGVGHQAAVAGDQRHFPGAIVELLVGALEQVLDEGQREVGADCAAELVADHDRHVEGRHHHGLAAHFVGGRVDDAGTLVLFRTGVELVLAHPGGQQLFAIDAVGHGLHDRLAVGAAIPPGQVAAVRAVALAGLPGEGGIGIEGIGFPGHEGVEQLGVVLYGAAQQRGDFVAAGVQLRHAVGARLAEQAGAVGQAVDHRQRILQLALDLADLGAGQGHQALVDDLLQQALGALLHQLLRSRAGEQGVQHQHHDDA